MPPRRSPPKQDEPFPKLCLPRDEVRQQIADRISKGEALRDQPIGGLTELKKARGEYYTWDEVNQRLLRRVFDSASVATEYQGFSFGGLEYRDLASDRQQFVEDYDYNLRKLSSILESLDLYDAPTTMATTDHSTKAESRHGSDIFIVHGQDSGTKNTVARFVQSVTGLEPRILHELPNQGRTIIEKLVHYSKEVGFAIVLLTPDDVGASKAEFDAGGGTSLHPRARQNVLLELGYFLGVLGRDRVCALSREGTEVPSDYQGVLFVPLDPYEGWKRKLAQELQAARFPIDSARLLAS